MVNKTLTLYMTDSSGKSITRTIDAVNAMTSGSVCWELRGINDQRKNIEYWINERGNEQHLTNLTLKEWYFNFKKGVFY